MIFACFVWTWDINETYYITVYLQILSKIRRRSKHSGNFEETYLFPTDRWINFVRGPCFVPVPIIYSGALVMGFTVSNRAYHTCLGARKNA